MCRPVGCMRLSAAPPGLDGGPCSEQQGLGQLEAQRRAAPPEVAWLLRAVVMASAQ